MNRKKLILVIASLVILVVIGLAAIPLFVDTQRIQKLVVSQLEANLNRRVSVQSVELTIFTGPGLRLRQVVVYEAPKLGSGPFVSLDSLRVRVRLLSLLWGRIEAGSIQLDRPVVNLARSKSGDWNFSSILKPGGEPRPGSETPEVTKAPPAPSSSAAALSIPELSFRDGTLLVRDERQARSAKESRYEHIDLELSDLSSGKVGAFSLQLQVPGQSKQSLRFSGDIGPLDFADLMKAPIDGRMEFSKIPLSSLIELVSPLSQEGIDWTGVLTARVSVKGALSETFHMEGNMRFDGIGYKSPGHESPEVGGELLFKLGYQSKAESLQIEQLQIRLPTSTLAVDGAIRTQKGESAYNLKANSDKCSVDDLLKLASIFGQGPPKGVETKGDARFHLTIQGSSKSPELTGQASLSGFQARYPGLQETITLSPWTLDFVKTGMSSNEVQIAVGSRTRLKARTSASFSLQKQVSLNISSQNPVLISDLLAVGSTFGMRLPAGYSLENGTAEFQMRMRKLWDSAATLAIDGQAIVAGSRLRAPLFKIPLDVKKAVLKFTGDSIDLADLQASLSGSNLQGKLQLIHFNSPSLVFGLNIDQIELAGLDKVINSEPVSIAASTSDKTSEERAGFCWDVFFRDRSVMAAGRALSRPVHDPLAKLVIRDSQATIQTVKYDTFVMKGVTSKVQMKNKVLDLRDLQFRLNQGTHAGSVSLDFTGDRPRYTFSSKLRNVDVNECLSQNTSLKNMIYGMLSLEMGVNGSGSSFDEITRNMKGEGEANLAKGRLLSFNLNQQIAALGRLAGLDAGQTGTEITDLAGSFRVAGGRVSSNDLRLRTPTAVLKAIGSFGFDKSVDFQIIAEFSSPVSKKYGSLNPLLDIATATFSRNDQGNIVLPLRMTGTISGPHFALDSRMVQDNLKKRGVGDALKSLQGMFKSKSGAQAPSGEKPGQEATGQPAEKKSSLEDLFKGLLDKAKEKEKDKTKK